MENSVIENINSGVCQWRVTNNKPPYFVNYSKNKTNKYEFFNTPFEMYQFKNKLKSAL